MSLPVVVLCGGQGTRMGSTVAKKELVDIGGHSLLWHVMQIFGSQGHTKFVLALGHLADQVRDHFEQNPVSWDLTFVDTGLKTEKASRIARVAEHLGDAQFFVAYGEAVADIDLDALLAFHRDGGALGTVTGAQVEFPLGVVNADDAGSVTGFEEKPTLPYWINGGFMVFEHAVLDMMRDGDDVDLERHVLPKLAADGQLKLYRHTGYWRSMKTLKDALDLNAVWETERPWKVWE